MNKNKTYNTDYYIQNHLKHLKSFYGFLIKLYYRYIASYIMANPAKIKQGDKVLDIGCGVGTMVMQFDKLGFDTTGIDVNSAAINNSIYTKKCLLVETTAKLDYPDNYFDLIVSREVLEHIPLDDIDDCIKEWQRVSKGKMVHIIAVQERGKSAIDDPTHLNVQDENWWQNKFEEHGFKVIKKPKKLFFSHLGSSGYFIINPSPRPERPDAGIKK